METNQKTRMHETVMEMPASVERVWKAITEASEVAGWYAPEARIDGRVGGEYWVSWGEGMDAAATIEVFDAPHHLRVIYERKVPGSGDEPVRFAIDYTIDAMDGGAMLRLVHSGFLATPEWDGEFDGTRQGWAIMLRILRYTLAHHANEQVRQAWFYTSGQGSANEMWNRLRAMFGNDSIQYEVPPKELFARTAEGSMVYLAVGDHGGTGGISANVVEYGAVNRLGEAVEHWKEKLNIPEPVVS